MANLIKMDKKEIAGITCEMPYTIKLQTDLQTQ